MSLSRSFLSAVHTAAVATALLIVACAGAGLLAACGGSSAGASAAPSASPGSAGLSPTPVPSPQVTSGTPPSGAVEVVRRFWTLLGEDELAKAKRTVVAPGSPIQQWDARQDGIAAARFVKVVGPVGRGPVPGATLELTATVWIEQDPSEPVLWGDRGEHQLFEHVVRMSDGTWRMWDSGTGP